jgi:hypothetical protein
MNNQKHLKKKYILIQLSDGSGIYLQCFIKKKELLTEVDIRSNILGGSSTIIDETHDNKSKTLNNFKKLFVKLK